MAPASKSISKLVISNSLVETPSHFFKIILPSTLEGKKLNLPEKFVRKFGTELSALATLRGPTGGAWQVRLTREGPMIWFQDGWQAFVKHHSIKCGYFLVFKYVKSSSSIFNVLIFDTSACEIDYPYHGGEPADYQQQNGENLRRSKRAAATEGTWFKQGLERQSKKCKVKELVYLDESDDMSAYELLASLEKMGIIFSEKCSQLTQEERNRVFNVARLFKPRNPCFMVIMGSTYLSHPRLYVPAKFAKEYWSKDTQFIKIRASNGSELRLKIRWRPAGGFYITKDWSEFSREKDLGKGDICLFELIRRKDILLEVSVFRANLELK